MVSGWGPTLSEEYQYLVWRTQAALHAVFQAAWEGVAVEKRQGIRLVGPFDPFSMFFSI